MHAGEGESKVVFDIFGDESVSGNFVVYAIVIVPAQNVATLVREFAALKESHGQSETAELHCRVLFNVAARSRSVLRDLSNEQVFSLYGDFAAVLTRNRAASLCVFADKSRLPDSISGGPWQTRSGLYVPECSPDVEFGDKQLASFCANASQLPLKEFPGLDSVRFWADPDRTRITWLGGRRQASTTLRMWLGSPAGTERVSPQAIPSEKPSLLQAADFVAYFFARSRRRRFDGNRKRFKDCIERLNPFVGELRLGSDGGLGVSIPTRKMEVYLRAEADRVGSL